MTDTKRVRKAASAIYITCDKEVADDISAMLSEAADDIDALKAEVERLQDERCHDPLCVLGHNAAPEGE